MRLLYLHGPPASGKYTVAVELEELVGASNLHNHLTLDVARAVFPFGTPQFWELVQELRMVCLKAARKLTDSVVVTTSCYSHPHDEETFREMERIVEDAGGKLLPERYFNVLLKCRRKGIGTALMDAAEALVAKRSAVVGLGVGLHPGYGSAQRLYVRRGYIPDGAGVVVDGKAMPEGSKIRLDDDPMLRMTRELD